MKKKKILIIICDGLGDRPVKELGNRTPLQYAKKKDSFNWFAKNGVCGIMDPIGPGISPGSDTGHLAILGYDPYKFYTGRGPFEAAGINMDVKPGDVAFRCNFATVDKDFKVMDRRAGRIRVGTSDLAKSLNDNIGGEIDGVKIWFKEAVEHRAVLVLRGSNLSHAVADTDPHANDMIVPNAKPLSKDAEFTATILNKFVKRSYEILNNHPINIKRMGEGKKPANIILTRGAGTVPHLDSIEKKFGLKGCCVAGISLIKGVCKIAGMDIISVVSATGGIDTDMIAKANATIKALDSYDFVFLNVKAPDIYGHDGDAQGKVKCIRQIDEMLGVIKNNLKDRDDVIIALTSDHSTPVTVMDHSGDPVPLTIIGEGIRVDNVKIFDEQSTANGGLGRIRGNDLIPILLDLAHRSKKFGS